MNQRPPGLPPTVFIPANPPAQSPAFFADIFTRTDSAELRAIAFANWLRTPGRSHAIGQDTPDPNPNIRSQ